MIPTRPSLSDLDPLVASWWQQKKVLCSESHYRNLQSAFSYMRRAENATDVRLVKTAVEDGARFAGALYEKRGPAVANKYRGYLTDLLTYLQGYGQFSGAELTTWPTFRRRVVSRFQTLSREAQAALVERNDVPAWLRAYVTVAVGTGLRQGTIRKLRYSMLKDGVLSVPGEIMKTGEPLVIPVTDAVAAALVPLWSCGGDGRTLPEKSVVYREFKRAMAGLADVQADAPDLIPHDLRRTFVARMTEAGAPMHLIMAVGGWKSDSVMIRHYARRAPIEAARAALVRAEK